jgi:predicted transposase YdaD
MLIAIHINLVETTVEQIAEQLDIDIEAVRQAGQQS